MSQPPAESCPPWGRGPPWLLKGHRSGQTSQPCDDFDGRAINPHHQNLVIVEETRQANTPRTSALKAYNQGKGIPGTHK